MSDWRGYLILGIGIAVPLLLLAFRRDRYLLAWICLTVSINVFDARVGLNLPAARIAGLLVLPYLAFGSFRFAELLETIPFRLFVAQLAYLVLMGVVMGLLFPWPDEGFIRGYFQTTSGRAIVYLGRSLADFGLVLFVARQVMTGLRPRELLRYLLFGIAVAGVGGLVEFVTRLPLYQLLTGYPTQEVANRIRGLNFEPRGLGLVMAHGMFIGLLVRRYARDLGGWWFITMCAVLFVLTVSVSALLAAGAMWVAVVLFVPELRRSATLMGAAAALAAAGIALEGGVVAGSWSFNVTQRLSIQAIGSALADRPFEALVLALDIFDLTAVLALQAHPLAAIFGAGPGLVTLPASNFIPDNDARWLWVGSAGEGITSLPSMGIVLEWANGGVIGVVLWIALVVAIIRCCSCLAVSRGQDEPGEWRLARGFVILSAAAYVVQASPISAYWSVVLGTGLGAAWLARQAVNQLPQPREAPADRAVLGPSESPA
jgi:hypothetical protein